VSAANQTISDFRAALTDSGSIDTLFDTFLVHLQKEHGLALAREGVMVDASFCEVPRQRNSREDNARIKADEVPQAEIMERTSGDKLHDYTAADWLNEWCAGKADTKSAAMAERYAQVTREFLESLGGRAR
jgi:hypothetical protein